MLETRQAGIGAAVAGSDSALVGWHSPLNTNHSRLPLWYAAYTCAHHEKRVAEQLTNRQVEHFLPLYNSVRRWKDRRVTLPMPLFPGYIFVRIDLRDRLRVLEIPSVARLVGFNGSPTPLPDGDIEKLRGGLAAGLHAEPYHYLQAGRRVRVTSGPLEGLEGVLIRRKNLSQFIVSLELIQRSVCLQIDSVNLESAG